MRLARILRLILASKNNIWWQPRAQFGRDSLLNLMVIYISDIQKPYSSILGTLTTSEGNAICDMTTPTLRRRKLGTSRIS